MDLEGEVEGMVVVSCVILSLPYTSFTIDDKFFFISMVGKTFMIIMITVIFAHI